MQTGNYVTSFLGFEFFEETATKSKLLWIFFLPRNEVVLFPGVCYYHEEVRSSGVFSGKVFTGITHC
jgi:hypothetical protein